MPLSDLQAQLNLFGITGWCSVVNAGSTQFVTANDDLARLKLVLDKKMHQVAAVSTLSVVGDDMSGKADVICAELAEAGVLVRQNKRSSRCLTLLINEEDHQLAVNIVHKRFVVEPESLDNRPLLAVS
jgi:aspartate kinase